MKQILPFFLLVCGLWPFSTVAQVGVADPATGNALIDFYGRVVDQNGKPLAGVKVTVDVLVAYLQSPTVLGTRDDKTTLATDTAGDFTLTGANGHSLKIESIDKDGYELSHKITRLYPYSWAANIFHPDPMNPVLFVLWDKDKKSPLISGDKNFDFIPDGRSYAVDLEKRTITQATNSEGDFQFHLTRFAEGAESNKFDWSFSFQGQNGNLLQQSSHRYLEMTFSPKDRFTNVYEETHKASDPDWRRIGHRQFYLKLQDGRAYGKATLIWDAGASANGPKTNEAGIRIQYTINPTGLALVR